MSEPLVMWTVYEGPRDFPTGYVVRKFLVTGEADPLATQEAYTGTLEAIRQQMLDMGLACITRSPHDEPQIVETWL